MAWIDDDFADDMAWDGSRTEDWIDDLLEVDETEEDMALVCADGERKILIDRVDVGGASVIREDQP